MEPIYENVVRGYGTFVLDYSSPELQNLHIVAPNIHVLAAYLRATTVSHRKSSMRECVWESIGEGRRGTAVCSAYCSEECYGTDLWGGQRCVWRVRVVVWVQNSEDDSGRSENSSFVQENLISAARTKRFAEDEFYFKPLCDLLQNIIVKMVHKSILYFYAISLFSARILGRPNQRVQNVSRIYCENMRNVPHKIRKRSSVLRCYDSSRSWRSCWLLINQSMNKSRQFILAGMWYVSNKIRRMIEVLMEPVEARVLWSVRAVL